MQRIAYFLCYSNIWIALGAASSALMYSVCFQKSINWSLLLFLFSSTLLAYTFQRFEKLRKKEGISGPRMDWMIRSSKTVKGIMVVGLLSTVVSVFFLSVESWLLLPVTALISFFYAFKIKGINLRDIPFVKIILIGAVWALSAGWMFFIEDQDFSRLGVQYSFFMFLYIIAITIPFDIRDIHLDETGKKTIPQLFGIKGAKVIAVTLTIIAFLLLESMTVLNMWFHLLAISISVLAILYAHPKRHELYFSFGVDGLLIVIPVLAYLLNIL